MAAASGRRTGLPAARRFTLLFRSSASRRKCPFKKSRSRRPPQRSPFMPDRPRSLIIEDEPEIRRFLRVSLSSHDFDLVESEKGRDGILQSATHQPDLIILDLGL